MEKLTRIGSRLYLTESTPIPETEHVTVACLVLWGFKVLQLDYNWESGWVGEPKNKTYTTAHVSELNSSKFIHVPTHELYRIVKTNSLSLNKRFNLQPLASEDKII